MFQVVYIPKVEDEVIVIEFDSIEEAESHM